MHAQKLRECYEYANLLVGQERAHHFVNYVLMKGLYKQDVDIVSTFKEWVK